MAIALFQRMGRSLIYHGLLARRSLLVVLMLLMPISAAAQDAAGAGRVEIGSAIFGGGMMLTPSTTPAESASRSYVVGSALTANVNRWIGLEGDVSLALGRSDSLALYGVAPTDRRTPNVLIYADYCLTGVKNDAAAQPGRRVVRSVQRVYGGLVMTF